MRAFFGLLSTLVLFLTPMLTMGVFSEERKRGTMELLMTSPITESQIVLGKFLASLTLFAIMLLPTAGYLIFTYARSEPVPPWRMLIAGYLGIMLLGGCCWRSVPSSPRSPRTSSSPPCSPLPRS